MLVWPVRYFPAAVTRRRLVGRTLSGGQTISGLTQSARTDGGGLLVFEQRDVFLHTPELVNAWKAWESILDGGVTQVVVPKSNGGRAPAPRGVPVPEPVCASPFPVEVADYVPTGPIVASVVGALALRATQAVIRVSAGAALKGGEEFAINHATKGWRCYTVGQVVSSAGADYTVKFRSPLREAVEDGASVDFNGPACVMRLADPEAFSAELEFNRFGRPSAIFVEDFGDF